MQFPSAGYIQTIAGGTVGDGRPLSDAIIDPRGLAVCTSPTGTLELYIADGLNNRIRTVDAAGIRTIAGTGQTGFAGDGGPAVSAQFDFPTGVACDAAGNIYVSDTNNNRVRKIDTRGIITTLAGNGVAGFSGDGSPATQKSVGHPRGLALDANGNLYIADFDDGRVRKLTPTGTISTVAGGGTGGDGIAATQSSLANPTGVAVDGAGNLYIADYNHSRIRKVDTQGFITTVAGNGYVGFSNDGILAQDATLNHPFQLTLDSQGDLLFVESGNFRVRRIDAVTGVLTTVAGACDPAVIGSCTSTSDGDGGPATSASLFAPNGLAVDANGTVYVGVTAGQIPSSNNRVRTINSAGILDTLVGGGIGDGGPAPDALIDPRGLVAARGGGTVADLYIADADNNRVRRIDGATDLISTVAGNGTAGFSGDGGPAISAALKGPLDVALDSNGNVYIADTFNNRVRRVDLQGNISTVAGNGVYGYGGDGGNAVSASLAYPYGLAVDAAANLYIADFANNRIRKVTPQGRITTIAGTGAWGYSGDGGLATQATLANPTDVALGADGSLYIAYYNDQALRRVIPGTDGLLDDGVIETVAGNGYTGFSGDGGPAGNAQLNYPFRLAFDAQGNLYIGDAGNYRVRRISAVNGIVDRSDTISTIAGTGTAGIEGDGGLAVQANLMRPTGLSVDPTGYLYIAQSESARVRAVGLAAATAMPTSTAVVPTPTATRPPATPTPTSTPTANPTTSLTLSGQVRYYSNNASVNGVTVRLQGTTAGTVTTGTTGQFAFSGLSPGSTQLTPLKTGDTGTAISALDAVYVLEAAAGQRTLTGSQKLACDVTGDGLVTALDAAEILQYRVGLITRFPVSTACNSDWSFIPVPIPTPNQQLIQPQMAAGSCRAGAIAYQPLSASASGQDFAAVLFGDCTGDWQPSSTGSIATQSVSASSATVTLGRPRARGHRVEVPLYVGGASPFRALDAEVDYDAAQLAATGVRPLANARGALVQANPTQPGHLTISLASASSLRPGATLLLSFARRHVQRSAPTFRVTRATVATQ